MMPLLEKLVVRARCMSVLVVTAMYVYSYTTYNIFCHHNLDSTPKICPSPTIMQDHLQLRHKSLSSHAHSVGTGMQSILGTRWPFDGCLHFVRAWQRPTLAFIQTFNIVANSFCPSFFPLPLTFLPPGNLFLFGSYYNQQVYLLVAAVVVACAIKTSKNICCRMLPHSMSMLAASTLAFPPPVCIHLFSMLSWSLIIFSRFSMIQWWVVWVNI